MPGQLHFAHQNEDLEELKTNKQTNLLAPGQRDISGDGLVAKIEAGLTLRERDFEIP